jgi:nicotinate-nucleotide adenylyltransferase
MKIGLFGGTFDPIHFGHLNLAVQLFEKNSLDQVLLCPVFQSPFKNTRPVASPEQRAKMVSLAIQELPAFRLLELEIKRGGVSYTIDTLRALHSSEHRFFLLLSEEAIPSFHLWKEASELVCLAQPLVGSRHPFSQKIPKTPLSSALLHGITETTVLEISSSDIRKRLSNRLYCGHLVPSTVLDFIKAQKLYIPAT